MREILFRGQTRRRGEKVNIAGDKLPGRWVYGGVLQGTGDYSIIYGGENPNDIEKHTVYTDTIGQYTGIQIPERQVTDKNAYLKMKRVWQDDLIAIYSIGYDDDDNPTRTHVATVRVQFDDNYKMFFAECVKGSMRDIAYECNINYLDDEDYPFTYWLEYMENGSGQFWEWEIIGNIHDNPELIGGGQDDA